MGGYYDETLAEIRQLIAEGNDEEALFTIEKELRMPYVPEEFGREITKLRKDLIAAKNAEAERGEDSLDTLLSRLKGNDLRQLQAAQGLSKRNLRGCLEEIRAWLGADPCPEAAALIIEAIAEQEINDFFVYEHDGITCEFYGDSVVPCTESGGFRKALHLLSEWVENDNPALFSMCRTLLIREVYMFLPLSYEEEEGYDLALEILREVSELNDGGTTYREVCETRGLHETLKS